MNNEFRSLSDIVKSKTSNEDLTSFFYKASKYMELLHSNGLYVTDFKFQHVKDTGSGVVFERCDVINNPLVGRQVESNIKEFAEMMVGAYIGYSLPIPAEKIKKDFKEIQYLFPSADIEYLSTTIYEENEMYYHDYVDRMRNFFSSGNTTSNSVALTKSKSTAAGRAFSEKESYKSQAAYANVLIIAGIISLITLVAVLTYIIMR